MRVFFLCDDEPFEIPSAVLTVMRRRPRHSYTVLSFPGHGSFSKFKTNLKRYMALYGPLGFPVRAVQFIFYKFLAALGIPTRRPHSLREAASRAGATYLRIEKINTKRTRRALSEMEPDVFFSIACPQILRKKTLELPKYGVYNIHTSLLPRNRGMLPSFWTLLENKGDSGVTLHKMNPKLDDGPILLQRRVPATLHKTSLHELIRKGKEVAADLICEAIELLESGDYTLKPNPEREATMNTFPTRKDVRRFRRMGGRVW
ncbi:hypothetical protein GF402_03045 [Candidatus Fermentibacteria bacterium]|nr:hypothetical protein [Candidatus Fermentibacteria bacterium]